MRKSLFIPAALGIALVANTSAAPPPGLMEQLCSRLCGGAWEPDHPAYPDEIRTSKTYAFNAASGTVNGLEHSSGGVAFTNTQIIVTYAWDDAGGALAVQRRRDDGTAPISGTVELGSDGGFTETLVPAGRPGEKMITLVSFPDADTMVTRSEIISPDLNTMGAEQRYVRKK